MKKTSNNSQDINKNLVKLTKQMERLNSFKFSLLRGIMTGVGTAIGATIVAAILITILGRLIQSVEDVPILNDIIKSTNIDSVIKED